MPLCGVSEVHVEMQPGENNFQSVCLTLSNISQDVMELRHVAAGDEAYATSDPRLPRAHPRVPECTDWSTESPASLESMY